MCLITPPLVYSHHLKYWLPPKVLGLIGWVDEVVVWIVWKFGCIIQFVNVATSANVQEQPA